ncbi:hypothetical protein BV898_16792 [Hypsibius exemplaris]|uniref:Uncharacterized protein n=1 Tax=Hypsibius exemplaris TaxID=2072580 RepID=A0A9X6NE66_HYPEX|nr:hypothetical protein BV898_16792 [Hypsibius exemplaris]
MQTDGNLVLSAISSVVCSQAVTSSCAVNLESTYYGDLERLAPSIGAPAYGCLDFWRIDTVALIPIFTTVKNPEGRSIVALQTIASYCNEKLNRA